ncbi:hypothetical protein B0H10DRAFT_650843 [Mycena sp. CBHHK59/15]|nr:hypothetical protein B0H10DRAFT_650843 [Mycena sp. CBHHK59/15]
MVSRSSPPQNKKESSAVVDDLLASAAQVATLASSAAKLAPVPYLVQCLALVGDIATTVQDVRANRKAFGSLADDARELITAAEGAHETGSKMPGHLIESLRVLLGTLEKTRDSASKPLSDNLFKRVNRAKTDKSKVDKYRQEMGQGLAVFGVKAQIRVEADIRRISDELQDMRPILKPQASQSNVVREKHRSVPAAVQNMLLEHADRLRPVLGVCIAFKQAPSVLQISRVLAIDANQVTDQLGYISPYLGPHFDSTNSLSDVELSGDLEQWLVSREHAGALWIHDSKYHSRVAQWCLVGKRTYDVRDILYRADNWEFHVCRSDASEELTRPSQTLRSHPSPHPSRTQS